MRNLLYKLSNNLHYLRIIIGITLILFFNISCSTAKYIPIETREIVRINYIDSLRIIDSVIVTPIERIKDIVPLYDTLKLETSLAYSETYVDTNSHSIVGKIENKKQKLFQHSIETRVIEKMDTIYIFQKVPYGVEKKEIKHIPKSYWILLVYSLFSILIFYLMIKKH